jgi:hypothetical protein
MTFNRPRPGSIFTGRPFSPQPGTHPPAEPIHDLPLSIPPSVMRKSSVPRKTCGKHRPPRKPHRYHPLPPPPDAIRTSSVSPMSNPGPSNGSGKIGSRGHVSHALRRPRGGALNL